jgi:hypothetical protein
VSRLHACGAADVRIVLGPGSILSHHELETLKAEGLTGLSVGPLATWKELDRSLRPAGPAADWWEEVWCMLIDAVSVFGPGRVRLHLGLGPGETEELAVKILQLARRKGLVPLIRPLRPAPGLKFVPTSTGKYYRILAARRIILDGLATAEAMQFNEYGQIIHYGLEPDRFEEVMRAGVVSDDLRDCVDCENHGRQEAWKDWIEALEPRDEPLPARMRRLCAINWEEAWTSQRRVIQLSKFDFSEAELESAAGSPYALIASYARRGDDDDDF